MNIKSAIEIINNDGVSENNIAFLLKDQCKEIQDIIFKYKNQWEQTKGLYSSSEESEPTARLIRLLFNLIQSDIDDVIKSYEENK